MTNSDVVLDLSFPTANGRTFMDRDGVVHLDRDLRDSTGARWYWHVGLAARRDVAVEVRLADVALVGRHGVVARRRRGAELRPTDAQGRFRLDLLAGERCRLAPTWPYGPGELRQLRTRLGDDACWRMLPARSRRHAAPVVHLGSPESRHLVVLTARHHACEAMGSYVMEGALECFARLSREGDRSVRAISVLAVPMMDVDGVRRGDQGKGRRPWDHNRDYASCGSRYESVRGLRRLLAVESRTLTGLDLHTPGLRGDVEERPHVVLAGDAADQRWGRALRDALDDARPHTVARPGLLTFDEEWNAPDAVSLRGFTAWLRSLPTTVGASTLEYPNATDGPLPTTPGLARAFGADALRGALLLA